MVIREIIDYLNEDYKDQWSQLVLRIRIRNMFDLTEEQTEKVYKIWKAEYMKPKVQAASRYGGRVKC